MPVTRRTALTIVGGTILGLGTAGAGGAFNRVSFTRDLTVASGDDRSGYLAIEPHPDREGVEGGPDIGVTDGRVYLDFTPADINPGSETLFRNIVIVTNNGTNEVDLSIDAMDDAGDVVDEAWAFPLTDPNARELGTLDPGAQVEVGFGFDATDPALLESIVAIDVLAEAVAPA